MMIEWFVGEPYAERAAYTLELLLDVAGLPNRRTYERSRAGVIYDPATSNVINGDGALVVRPGPVQKWNRVVPDDAASSYHAFGQELRAVEGRGDLLQLAFGLLSGAFEGEPRNAMGVPSLRSGALAELGLRERPRVLELADQLAEWILKGRGQQSLVPRWPGGARYAIALTHDVDLLFSRPELRFVWFLLYRNVVRRDIGHLPIVLASAAKSLLYRGLRRIPPPERDPNFRLDDWFALESKLGGHGTFYFASTSVADPWSAGRDVVYDYRNKHLQSVVRRGIAAGAEVGLHASINARQNHSLFALEKARLESQFGVEVVGLRHHYWAIDPEHPVRTLKAHQAAGFKYDSSLGVNDAPGFRRGTCLPFRPYDLESERPLELLEVPPTLMDGGIFRQPIPPEGGEEAVLQHLRVVAQNGGAAVLNWHPEQSNPALMSGAGPALLAALSQVAGAGDVFWTTARGLAEWWIERERLLRTES